MERNRRKRKSRRRRQGGGGGGEEKEEGGRDDRGLSWRTLWDHTRPGLTTTTRSWGEKRKGLPVALPEEV